MQNNSHSLTVMTVVQYKLPVPSGDTLKFTFSVASIYREHG